MRSYYMYSELLNSNLVDGEVIKFRNKTCRVSLIHSGPLDKLKQVIILTPIQETIYSEDRLLQIKYYTFLAWNLLLWTLVILQVYVLGVGFIVQGI